VKARAAVRAAAGPSGAVRLVELRSEPPIVLRQTPDALYLVGAAGGPLGGDELSLEVVVEGGASLVVRSAAATLAQPGAVPGRSRLVIRLHVCAGGSLVWRPEPLVSIRGSDHETVTEVTLEGDALLVLVEEIVLGRHHEESGRVRSHTRVERDGRPVLTHTIDVGAGAPSWSSAAVIGDARVVITELHAPTERAASEHADSGAMSWHDPAGKARAARFPLPTDAVLLLALGSSLSETRAAASAVR
jgi:urease accessory protein